MSYQAKVIADSVSPWGHRLTTMVVSFPKLLLPEVDIRHAFIYTPEETPPISERLRQVLDDPFIPDQFQPDWVGPAHLYIPKELRPQAIAEWTTARLYAATSALKLLMGQDLFQEHFASHAGTRSLGEEELSQWLKEGAVWLNKLTSNRLSFHEQRQALLTDRRIVEQFLVPFLWQEAVLTATEWEDSFRRHADEDSVGLQKLLEHMRAAYYASTPTSMSEGHVHSAQPPTEEYLDLSEHRATPFIWGEWNVRRSAARLYQRLGGSREWAGSRIDSLLMSTEFNGKLRGWRQLERS